MVNHKKEDKVNVNFFSTLSHAEYLVINYSPHYFKNRKYLGLPYHMFHQQHHFNLFT